MTKAKIVLPRDGVSVEVNHADIQESAGKHDLSTLHVENAAEWEQYLSRPAIVTFYDGAVTKNCYGYLDTVVPNVQGGDRQGHLLVLGLTAPMRSGHARVWRDRTPTQIANDILHPYAFGLEIDQYDLSIPYFAQQSGQSDWQALRRLADECGMVMHPIDGVVRLVHPEVEIRRNISVTKPVYVLNDTNVLTSISTDTPVGWEHRRLFGVDKFGKDFNIEVNKGAPVSLDFSEPLAFLGDAISAAKRLERRRVLRRRAVLSSVSTSPITRAGDCIVTQDGRQQTLWYVIDATHTVIDGFLSTVFSLCRSGDNAPVLAAPRKPLRYRPNVVLTESKWRAQTHYRESL